MTSPSPCPPALAFTPPPARPVAQGPCRCNPLRRLCRPSPQRPGINYIDPEDFDAGRLRAQLAVARDRGASLTVVFIHWGPNWRWLPSK